MRKAMRTVELTDELAELLGRVQPSLEKATSEAAVLELYRRGIISSGKAGELLGMDRFVSSATQTSWGSPSSGCPG
jgi:hypothetical protein